MMRIVPAGVLAIVVCAGCGGTREEPPPAVKPAATVFSFTNTVETVSGDEITVAEKGRLVEADFDLDGLSDLAVVEKDEDGGSRVGIYILRRGAGPDAQGSLYYRGGWVRPVVAGDIIGVISSRRDGFTDLILLASQSNAPNAMLHFTSDGRSFRFAGE